MIRSITIKLVLTAGVFAAVFHFIIPVGLMFLMALLLSFLSVMDPLHAKKHVEVIWYGFAEIAIFHTLVLFGTTISSILLSAIAISKWSGRSRYLAAAGFCLIAHFAILTFLALVFYIVGRSELLASELLFYYCYSALMGPLMGVLCVALGRQRVGAHSDSGALS